MNGPGAGFGGRLGLAGSPVSWHLWENICAGPRPVAREPGLSDRSNSSGALLRLAVRVAAVVALVAAARALILWAHGMMPGVEAGNLSALMIAMVLVAYAVMIALPYVPGIEVGVALLMLEGAWVAPAVWGATVAGLALAYGVGRLLPEHTLSRLLRDIGLHRAADRFGALAPLGRDQRLVLLRAGLPRWLGPLATRGRYLLLALLTNLPGNIALGGGGGLFLFAGFSRLFAPLPTLATAVLAVAPVPLVVWLSGYGGMH